MITSQKKWNHICVPVSEQILNSAKDFGLGKCKVIVGFKLIANDNGSLLDADTNYLISSEDLKTFIKSRTLI